MDIKMKFSSNLEDFPTTFMVFDIFWHFGLYNDQMDIKTKFPKFSSIFGVFLYKK